MTIFMRFEGMSEAVGTLRKLPAHLEKSTLLKMTQVAYDEAQKGAGRHTRPGQTTGALWKSLYNRPIPNGREIGHDPHLAPHAVFVQLGTKPHEIRPKNEISPRNKKRKAALRWAAGGKFFTFAKVKHPGYRGDPYLFDAAILAVKEFRNILDDTLKDAP
jgi:hypothetical protein